MRKTLRPDDMQDMPDVSELDTKHEQDNDHTVTDLPVSILPGTPPNVNRGAANIQRVENEEPEEELQRQTEEEEEEPIQAKLLQRQSEDEEEPVQTKRIQRLTSDGCAIQPSRFGYIGPEVKARQSEIRRILRSTDIQAKLTIGEPNDKYEQEADRVADQVMSMPDSKLQRQPEKKEEDETLQGKPLSDQITPLVQRQGDPPDVDEEYKMQAKPLTEPITPSVQRQEEGPEEEEEPVQTRLEDGATLQRLCPECEKETPLQRQPAEEEEEETLQTKPLANQVTPLVQRQGDPPDVDEEYKMQTKLLAGQNSPLVQRQEEDSEEEEEPVQTKLKNGMVLQRLCPECEKEEPLQRQPADEEEETLQTKSLIQKQEENPEEEEPVQARFKSNENLQRMFSARKQELAQRQSEEDEKEEELQTKSNGASRDNDLLDDAATTAVESKSSGSPLKPEVRQKLESGIGADFSNVRIHENAQSREATKSINAKAFTHQNDIWLGEGQSQDDLQLMAHEATHVVQQGAAGALQPKRITNTKTNSTQPPDVQCGFFEDIIEGASSIGRSAWEGIKSAGRTIGRGASGAWSWITGIGRSLGRSVGTAWNWIQDVGQTIGRGAATAWNWIKGVGRTLGRGITTAWDWIKDVGRTIGRGAAEAWDWIRRIGSRIGRGISDAWEWIKDVGRSIGRAAAEAWEWIKDVGRSIGRAITEAWEWIQEVARTIGRALVEAWEWIKDVARSIGRAITEAWEWIQEVARAIGRALVEALEWIKEVARAIGRALVEAWEWIKEVARALGRALAEAWEWIKSLARRIMRTIQEAWEWLKSVARNIWECIKGIVWGPGASTGTSGGSGAAASSGTVYRKPLPGMEYSRASIIPVGGAAGIFLKAKSKNINSIQRLPGATIQRYSKDIHYDATHKDARTVGYGPTQATDVAREDQAVDEGWRHPWITTPLEILNPRVSGKDMLHFPARGVAIAEMKNGIKNADVKTFGTGLHRFQDTFSHNFTTWKIPLRRLCSSWCWKLHPIAAAAILIPNYAFGRGAALKHACLGFYPDEHHGEQAGRDKLMRIGTRYWLRRFLLINPHRALLKFSSDKFNPGAGGPLTVATAGTDAFIESSAYSTSGTVKVKSKNTAQANKLVKDWDAGFIQTVKHSVRKAHYIGSKKFRIRKDFIPGACRDALVPGGAPWYDPNNSNGPGKLPFKKTNTSLNVSLWDQPAAPAPWDTPDKKGKLNHHDGRDVFTAWMIARKRTAPTRIEYLNWTSWMVDWRVTFDYASKKGTKSVKKILGKTKNIGSGKKQGKDTPVLGGKTANKAATVVWLP